MKLALKSVVAILIVLALLNVAAADGSDYSQDTNDCAISVRKLLAGPLSHAPEFATIHQAIAWIERRLPQGIRSRFIAAGRTISTSVDDWKRHGMIRGAFWNLQALSELLVAQSNQFNGVATCRLNDELGVTREILQDEIFIALNPNDHGLRDVLIQRGIDDPHYAKLTLMYGIMLDFANVTWTDEQLGDLAKFQLRPLDDPR